MSTSCRHKYGYVQGLNIVAPAPVYGHAGDIELADRENTKQQHKTPRTVFDDIPLLRPVIPENGDAPCLGEVLYYMFEWMARNKATDAAASTAWEMLAEVLPADAFPRQFTFAKKVLNQYLEGKVTTLTVHYLATSSPSWRHHVDMMSP
jgi:hypothetical protein